MNQELIDALRQIPSIGENGFEGLIAKLLAALTKRHFRLAQSGTQLGRDISNSSFGFNIIAVECKRYGKNTVLDERELLGELVQAKMAISELDLWVLVTTRDIPSQLDESLRSAAKELNITCFSISTDDGGPSSLEVLCAQAIGLVIEYLGSQTDKSNIQSSLEEIAASPDFNERVELLRKQFSSPLIGYDNWRIEQNNIFVQCLQSKSESRARFGQLINVEEDSVKLIKRETAWRHFDEWLNAWKNKPYPFVVLGEEGDGKTWSVASWLSHKLRSGDKFPPVLFLSSTNVSDKEPRNLFPSVVSHHLSSLQQEQWEKRIERWVTRVDDNNFPIFLLILDGINERRNQQWWRELLEKLAGQPWQTRVAVIITCRSDYWRRHFEPLRHLQAVTYTLPPYNDSELSDALAHHNLRYSDIREDILPLIRKPRYFDLMVKYLERVEETGDVTPARLIYEDWRDRLQRKHTSLDDDSFQFLICELARKYQKGDKYIKEQDIGSILPSFEDKQIMLEELRTGGILQSGRRGYQVNEKLLIYGFGLLLVDEIEEASNSSDRDLTDVLAEWLEPHAEMDLKAAICGFAALHALSLSNYSREAKIALLQTWVNSHNSEQTAESDFVAYMPLDPQSYIALAEIVWSDFSENAWAQELLMRSFLHWRESPNVRSKLYAAFERWLGFVHINGFSGQLSDSIAAEKVKQEISDRIGLQLQSGRQIQFSDYGITAIEDNGLMRLGRVAIAVISHLPRGPFMHAIATGCLAEAIVGSPSKYSLFAWLFQTASESICTEVRAEVNLLLTSENLVTQQAAHRLLSFEGSQNAYKLQQTLPQNLFSPNPLAERHEQDPCTSGFQWTQEQCEVCLYRDELSPQRIAEQIKGHCVNPNLSVPSNLGKRLEPLTETISIQQLKKTLYSDRDDYALEDYEPALCAYAPNAMANLVRAIIRQIEEREGFPLRQLGLMLKEHTLISRLEEQESIHRAWNKLLVKAETWSDTDKLAEAFLFGLVMKTLNAEEQLLHLIRRPEKATDLIACERSFLPINNWELMSEQLASASTTKTVQRILWFLTFHPKSLLKEIVRKQLIPFLKHEDSLIRSLILQILYYLEDGEVVKIVIDGQWQWNITHNNIENYWGSLLLCKYATSLPYSELQLRIHPIYIGYAIECRGLNKTEINQYADSIQHIWLNLKKLPALPLDCPFISIKASIYDDREPAMIHGISLYKDTHSHSVTSFARGAYWGGVGQGDSQEWQEMLSPNSEQQQVQSQTIREVIKQQANSGNVWFAERFLPHALNQIIDTRPDLVNRWLEAIYVNNLGEIQHLSLASSFYEELCAVLLKNDHDKGIRLYWQLQKAKTKVRIQDEFSEVKLLDYAFFQMTANKDAKSAWRDKLEQCKTDRELLDVAVLAQYGNGREWLWSIIEQGIQSLAAIKKSRAITLLGFVQEQKAFDLLNSLLENQPDTWVKRLLVISKQSWQKNNWAMHWYQRFLNASDDVTSWTSFRLFLHCLDSRFWYWQQHIEVEATSSSFAQKRQEFFKDNLDTIKNKIQKNEKPLREQYLGHKILQSQMWPWM